MGTECNSCHPLHLRWWAHTRILPLSLPYPYSLPVVCSNPNLQGYRFLKHNLIFLNLNLGTVPHLSSTLYAAPIVFSSAGRYVIRAVTFSADKPPSSIMTSQPYIIVKMVATPQASVATNGRLTYVSLKSTTQGYTLNSCKPNAWNIHYFCMKLGYFHNATKIVTDL